MTAIDELRAALNECWLPDGYLEAVAHNRGVRKCLQALDAWAEKHPEFGVTCGECDAFGGVRYPDRAGAQTCLNEDSPVFMTPLDLLDLDFGCTLGKRAERGQHE